MSDTHIPGVPKMTDDLRNILKETEGDRNVQFIAFYLDNQKIYSH